MKRARLMAASDRGTEVTQAEVATWMGVAGATVGRWEAGLKEPRLQTIERLAEVLGCNPSWLAFGVGEARAPKSDPPTLPYRGTDKDDAEPVDPPTAVKRRRRES